MGLLHLLKANKKQPKNEAGMNTADPITPPVQTKLPLEQGLDHLRAGRHDHAIVALRMALQREPGRFAAIRGLATAHLQANEPTPARKLLDAYTAEHPMSSEGWRLAAQLEWKLLDRPRAVEILYAGLKRLPQSAVLHRQLAVFLSADGKRGQAAAHAKNQPAQPRDIESCLQAAADGGGAAFAPLAADHDWLEQIAQDSILLKAILAPLSTDLSPLTGQTRQMLQDIEFKLARLLDAQPDHADRQLLLARVQSRLDAIPAAMLSCQRALRTSPNLVEAHRLKANLHARIGEIDQAIATLQALTQRGIDWPDIHYDLAALERQRGQTAQARSHLYSALRLNPQFQQAHDLLTRCAA